MITDIVRQINGILSDFEKRLKELEDASQASEQKIHALQQAQENAGASKKITRSKSVCEREGEGNPVRRARRKNSRQAEVGGVSQDESQAEVIQG